MLLDGSLTGGSAAILILALIVACGFEFVNGFHDTANAVATVIYTKAMRPWAAVSWSGFCNFCGVFVGGIAVAMSVMKLIPVELLVQGGTVTGLAMVFSLLLAAILWNLGTWYFGLPSSSSHTLIGAILGVALANSMLPGHKFGDGVNWTKAGDVAAALLFSPVIGFVLSGIVVLLFLRFLPNKQLHNPPQAGSRPPGWIRAMLIGTCTGVSFTHGSNDGQKGVGLIMLILIGILPMQFAINPRATPEMLARASIGANEIADVLDASRKDETEARVRLRGVAEQLDKVQDLASIRRENRFVLRRQILQADGQLDKLIKKGALKFDPETAKRVRVARASMRALTDYAPFWVLAMVAFSLGLGTMIGWKRIVITVGEKIGKAHLTYAQGASAELVAMSTIGLAAFAGLPVSTTHVLSSGIAGTMVARRAGLQGRTVRNIALAWLLTLPMSMLLAGSLFLALRRIL
jgi:PiT family inorganic phosphate transporter